MLALQRLELLRERYRLAALVPMPPPADENDHARSTAPLNDSLANDLLSSQRNRQQVDHRPHAALQAAAERAIAPLNTAARSPAAQAIVSPSCGSFHT